MRPGWRTVLAAPANTLDSSSIRTREVGVSISMRPARGSAVCAGLRAAADELAAVVDLRARLADIPRLEAILGEVAGGGPATIGMARSA